MTSHPQIRIWWDTSVNAYRMTSPYNETLVDAVKKHIPISDRSYDSSTKMWTFIEKHLAPLQNLIALCGLKAVVITRHQAETTTTQQPLLACNVKSLDVVLLEFVRLLPYEAAKAAYRRAALDLHPDKNNGASDHMTLLNTAWDRISKEVYGQ